METLGLTLKKPEPQPERLLMLALEQAAIAAELRQRVEEAFPDEVEIYEHLAARVGAKEAYEGILRVEGLYRKAGIA